MVMLSPLMPFEQQIIASLASHTITRTAMNLGMSRQALQVNIRRIFRRIEQAGGDSAPLRETIRQCHHRTRVFSKLAGRSAAYARTMIDGNEIGPRD